MRTGSYTLQQSLTAEAASTAKQAVSLARRRGHAQVTPLHVATVMFASSTGLLRRACLQSHSHPLQSKALELCFNVALNRLPTSTSSPILAPHNHPPSLSNALVAAFKRAQAHQRRGSGENHQHQQQPILALKIDIEQLVISILDDPSVSRVMREAGFSSTQVKSKVEQSTTTSLDIRSHSPIKECPKPLILGSWNNNINPQTSLPTSQFRLSISKTSDQHARNDDVMSIINTLTNKKKKNLVIVGECPLTAENVVRGVINKFDAGNVPGEMRSVQFISVPLYTLRNISREEFETKLVELRSLVKSLASRGVVLYLGDLRWVCEFWSKYGEQRMSGGGGRCYSPVEHMVMELSRLASGFGGCGKLWIMGTANFQTYMKCKNGCPSLETLWELHPLAIPAGSLALGLNLESDLNSHVRSKATEEGSSSWLLGKARAEQNLACCRDCLGNFNKEAKSLMGRSTYENDSVTTNSALPAWLRQYKEEKRTQTPDDQEKEKMKDLCTKWNSICKSVHKRPHFLEKASLNLPSPSPSSSASVSSNDSKQHLQVLLNWQSNLDSNHSPTEQNFFVLETEDEPKLENKPELLSNPNSSPNSASSSEASGEFPCLLPSFKENNQENRDILRNALEKVVPWQKNAVPEIVTTVLECRSKVKPNREETWLFFSGPDSEGKEKTAKEIANVVFGSQENFVNVGISSFSTEKSVDLVVEEVSNKRKRNEEGKSYFERFVDEVKQNPSRVFYMEDFEHVDYNSQKGFKKAIDCGSIMLSDGDLVYLEDAIIIFSSDSLSSSLSRVFPAPVAGRGDGGDGVCEKAEEIKKPCCSLDLNVPTDDYENGGVLSLVDKIVVFKV